MRAYGSIDGLTVAGNTVPMIAGTMASVETSCNVSISGNSYPGGTSEYSLSPARPAMSPAAKP